MLDAGWGGGVFCLILEGNAGSSVFSGLCVKRDSPIVPNGVAHFQHLSFHFFEGNSRRGAEAQSGGAVGISHAKALGREEHHLGLKSGC